MPFGYHNAKAPFGEQPVRLSEPHANGQRYLNGYDDLMPASDDPRWPQKCDCGYVFEPAVMDWCPSPDCQAETKRHKILVRGDQQQVFFDQLYRRVDSGQVGSLEELGPGCMWDAWWMGGDCKTPDGKQLNVILPNGDHWWIDGPAKGGGHWTRTGTPPKVTARPSIWASQGTPRDYHGFLTDGVLRRC